MSLKRIFSSNSDKKRIAELESEIARLKAELTKSDTAIRGLSSRGPSPRFAGNESDENPIILPTNGWDNETNY
jgi:hypothetical protein